MYYIIVNPTSKSGRGAKIWAAVEPVLKERNISYRVFFSEKIGHVMEIVKELTTSPDEICYPLKLIILGGDGTLNEALQGISDFDKVQIGYIPTGSSNDMARDLKLGKDPLSILDRILSCKQATPMDIGCVSYENISNEYSRHHSKEFLQKRYFAVSCGIGFDAAVCEEALASGFKNILNKIGLGKLTYLGIALKQLIAAKKVSCDIYINDEEPVHLKRFLFVAGMVHQYEGGGFMFCPGANYHDGVLDICAAGDISKLLILVALPTAFFGKHYMFKGIDKYSASVMKLKTSVPLWVHTDGEVSVKADFITLTCEKNKLQMLL
ncbi:MAG: diacylglycerol/lipid kinase family protein [Suilimivivens sp.]